MSLKTRLHRNWPLWTSFLIPVAIMLIYAIACRMYPFGNSSIQTVDLNQQYVDFFTYFRHTILGNPHGFFYSFSQALGSGMIGNWAYYMMSPLNLIFLFIPDNYINIGLLLVTLLYYGLAGMSFEYFLNKTEHTNPILRVMWSITYAMNGWMIANQLNMIWLACLAVLPMVVLGIWRINRTGRIRTFVASLAAIIMINYYMAYMICIFAVVYFLYSAVVDYRNWTDLIKRGAKFVWGAVFAFVLSAWIALPTIYSLSITKQHYNHPKLYLKYNYDPLEMTSKLFSGSLSFAQVKDGLPNIFVGAVALVSFLAYLLNKRVKVRKRAAVFLVTIFMILLLCTEPLDLIWHGMQYPVWYKYRPSFILCFWVILIASKGLNMIIRQRKPFGLYRSLTIAALLILGAAYVFKYCRKYSFMSFVTFMVTVLALMTAFIMIFILKKKSVIFFSLLMVFSTADVGVNACESLNHITFESNSNYVRPVSMLRDNAYHLAKISHGSYRIAKTFDRSEDDATNAQFPSAEAFSSAVSTNQRKFLQQMGDPESNGHIEYRYGTLPTDYFLGFRYYMTDNNSELEQFAPRPDFNYYHAINGRDGASVYRNPRTLPLIFASSQRLKGTRLIDNHPAENQQRLLNGLSGQSKRYFQRINLPRASYANYSDHPRQLDNATLITKSHKKDGLVSMTIIPKTNDPYYLEMSGNLNSNNSTVLENGHMVNNFTDSDQPVMVNVASDQKGQPIHIQMTIKTGNLWLSQMRLYRFNEPEFNRTTSGQHDSHVTKFADGNVKADVNAKRGQIMTTTIPYEKGWHLTVDGKPQPIHRYADMFIWSRLNQGHHSVHLTYCPPYLNLGILIGIIGCISGIGYSLIKRYIHDS